MFTDEELEGCPSPMFEKFLENEEKVIRSLAVNDKYLLREIISLLIECWNYKR